MYRTLIDEYHKWYKNLWAFVHVEDVARAIGLSLAADLKQKHDIFFLSADENWTGKESMALAKRFYPETSEIKVEFRGASSFITSNKAKAVLNFSPRYSVKDIVA